MPKGQWHSEKERLARQSKTGKNMGSKGHKVGKEVSEMLYRGFVGAGLS